MVDVLSRTQRSALMGRVRSRGNKTTELRMAAAFRAAGVQGWRRHVSIVGRACDGDLVRVRPDFVFRSARVVVFVDGCFWHGCPKHATVPKTRSAFWRRKICRNKQRDLLVTQALRRAGWAVFRIWEHDLRQEIDGSVKRMGLAVRIRSRRARVRGRGVCGA
jgi:DNA mismatch endonuclease (patch repair protein)